MAIKTGNNNILVVAGLGNPGNEYAQTRHNVGFAAIDYLTEKLSARMPKEKFDGLIFEARVNETRLLLVKPQTYMNLSGQCLAQLMRFYKLPPERLVVIYDDIDLPEGKLRVRLKGGPGTHNGMRSVVSEIQSKSFMRIRIGTGQPKNGIDLADYVLGKVSKEALPVMYKAICAAGDAAVEIAENGIDKAMQKYNTVG